jgi:radical SAM protein with 4Fe4S-binding SPASM domain
MAKHQGFLDLDLAKRLLDEMAEYLPVSLVPFFRGESLLHPHWFEILEYVVERGISPIQLTTNGMLLDSEVARKILDLGIDFISFSLDTLDPELYRQTRWRGCHEQVVENILNFLKLKQQRGAWRPQVQVSAVATASHRPGMAAFVEFWQPLVDRVRIYIEHSQDGYPGSIVEPLPLFARRLPCHKPFTDMVIYWDGQVALCNHDWTRSREESVGDLTRQNIATVWSASPYTEFRKAHLAGEVTSLVPCAHCDHWKMFYLEPGFLGELYENSVD